MRVGSLFSGGGGLDLAVQMLWPDAELAWYAEFDKHAAALLERRFPGVPNLGDLSTVDWSQVEPVDVMVGGYPCQPWSTAGQRKGFDDVRDGWPWFRDAIGTLRPRLALLENVGAHVVLGAPRTVGDLAALGYDAEWGTLRASDVGAPHPRARWFCVAHSTRVGLKRSGGARDWRPGPAHRSDTATDANGEGLEGRHPQRERPHQRSAGPGSLVDWGKYEPAIRRWESILERPAPAPMDGRGRLSADFVEWHMGWPAGWTEPLTRNQRLKILGNGVVPLQAAHAYGQLLDRIAGAVEVAA